MPATPDLAVTLWRAYPDTAVFDWLITLQVRIRPINQKYSPLQEKTHTFHFGGEAGDGGMHIDVWTSLHDQPGNFSLQNFSFFANLQK